MFKNLKLSTKVTIAFIVITLSMLTISISSYLGFNKIGTEIEEISEYQIPLNKIISQLEKDIVQEEMLTYELIIASKDPTSKEFIALEQKMIELEKDTDKKIKQSEELIQEAKAHSHDIETKEKYEMFYKLCVQLEELQKNFKKDLKKFELDLKNGHLENIAHEKEILHKELVSMDGNVTKLKNVMDDLLISSTSQAEKDEKSALLIIEIISVISLIFTIIIILIITKTIRTKIDNFQDGLLSFFKYLNRESTEVKHLDDSASDEFGVMSKVVNENITMTKKGIEDDRQVINDTIEVLSEFEQGDLCQRVKTSSNNPALKELTQLLNKMGGNIETNIDNVLNVLEQYSNSNYLNKVDTKGVKEHLLKLANGVNTLGDAITTMLVENKSNGLTLQGGSNLLLANVESLSSSSNQAAASLEETAAAIEQITSNVNGNTQNIIKMSSFANALSKSSNEGEQLAKETTVSMDEINDQVNAINEAISVIDQIAFQTNILSLNAAVEAATAGEAGKGFAVVAAEVRNLATRSADAAKEIKELVENATHRANNGKTKADKMIHGYTSLNENISKTIELINDIEMASKEQLGGIQQINDAVSELDQQTQVNANVASQTKDIAIQTDEIAKLVVLDVEKKEFKGKNEIKAKENTQMTHELEPIKISKQNRVNEDNDEWEDF